MTEQLSHLDEAGQARIVDVGAKAVTERLARAGGRIRMRPETLRIIEADANKKGDVLAAARIAGIMAAKRTAELIPLCHPLMLEHCQVRFRVDAARSEIEAICQVQVSGKTGVEMEALTGASVALLTIYDMCKAVDRGMEIHSLCLYEKTGGKSGHYQRAEGEA